MFYQCCSEHLGFFGNIVSIALESKNESQRVQHLDIKERVENVKDWAEVLAQCLRSLAAPPGDTGFKPSIQVMAYKTN